MKSALQFQTDLMTFVTAYGAMSKGLGGSLKAMKGVIDGIQA